MLKPFSLVFCVVFLLVENVAANDPLTAITPQQIQLFQSLSEEQQNQLLEKLRPGLVSGAVIQPKRWRGEPQDDESKPMENADQPLELSAEEDGESVSDADVLEPQEQLDNIKEVKPFGYDIFEENESAFMPSIDIPIPNDYLIGPGDEVWVQVFGKENRNLVLQVSREGTLNLPGIGIVSVAGSTFLAVKEQLKSLISKQFIGVTVHVSMGELRSIRIFVMGNVNRAGSYTVSSLSTLTNALFTSGGVLPIGSLRNIELKRQGKVVTTLDLYDLLMRGDTSADARLLPGDVIFVPPIGKTATIDGGVVRPAIYELKQNETILDLVKFAGGLLPSAYPDKTMLARIAEMGGRQLLNIDLNAPRVLDKPLQGGDRIVVHTVLEKFENAIGLEGHVERPIQFEWYEGIRVSNLIRSMDDLKPQVDMHYALLRREVGIEREITTVRVSLADVLKNPGSKQDPLLQPRDSLLVLGLQEDREEALKPLIEELQNQTRIDRPAKLVTLEGNVKFPGRYPLTDEMRLSDLVAAAVDVLPDTDLSYVLVQSVDQATRSIALNSYDLKAAVTNHKEANDPVLKPNDTVYIFSIDDDRQEQLTEIITRLQTQTTYNFPQQLVRIGGRVSQPGVYPLEAEMRLSDLIRAAGNLDEAAYLLDAEVSRYRFNQDGSRVVELININLAALLNGDVAQDIQLQPHDFLTIKEVPDWQESQTITLNGEVKFPGTYAIREGDRLFDVIKRAGGLSELAYPEGAVFMREELREKEQRNLDELRQRLQGELAAIDLEKSVDNEGGPAALNAANELANRLGTTKALGRLVIDLAAILDGKTERDVLLKAGDELIVPGKTQEISILGEVFYPTSHLYDNSLSISDYINMSGGMTQRSDDGRIYVVKGNGAVIKAGMGWFSSGVELQPGDTIVVPLDVEHLSSLRLWTNVSQIVYQLGVAVASWNAVGLF